MEIQRLNINYHNQFRRHKNKCVFCRQCGARVTVVRFADHLRDVHALDCGTACPFCYAKTRWKKGDIGKVLFVAAHRGACLKTFLKTHKKPPRAVSTAIRTRDDAAPWAAEEGTSSFLPPPPPFEEEEERTLTLYDGPMPSDAACEFCPTCYAHHRHGVLAQQLDGRTRRSDVWGNSFYDPFPTDALFFDDRGPNHVRFSEQSGLGLVAYNVFRCFLSGEYAFYHLMVRARLWWDFRVREWPGVHFSPFGCLCDGRHDDEEADAARVHHRHVIVAVRRACVAFFKKQWKSIVGVRTEPDVGGAVRRQRNKLCVAIDRASHLMYAVSYVSRRRASCDGYGRDDVGSTGSHYWMFRELSPCAVLSLGALFREGHATVVSRRHRDMSVSAYYHHVEKGSDGAWQVGLVHLGLKERRCVLPFAKGYELCDAFAADRPVVYVYGRPRYLRCVPSLRRLDHDDWLRHQIRTGNSFWECAHRETYALAHHQKRSLNAINAVMEGLVNVHARTETRLRSENEKLQRELDASRKRVQRLEERLGWPESERHLTTEGVKLGNVCFLASASDA